MYSKGRHMGRKNHAYTMSRDTTSYPSYYSSQTLENRTKVDMKGIVGVIFSLEHLFLFLKKNLIPRLI